MSLDAIKQVTQMEEACAQRKAEAVQAARKTVADAEKAGQALLEARRAEAETQVKAMITQAETDALSEARSVQQATEKACAAFLQSASEKRLGEAVKLIVGRVVNLS